MESGQGEKGVRVRIRLASSICTLVLNPANPRGDRYEGEGVSVPSPKEHQGCRKPGFKVGLELKTVSFFSFFFIF